MASHEVLILISADPPHRFRGIARLAGEQGWHIRTERRREPPRDWTGDGALVMLEDIPPLMAFVRRLRRRGIPVVDLLEDRPEVPLVRVAGDNPEIGRLAAEHFNARDFRHAAFFSVRHNHTHDLRLAGFRAAWKGAEPAVWLWPDVAGAHPEDWRRMGGWLADLLRRAPKPLAVFAWNDYDATHVLSACRSAGLKVPDEIAILGVDDNRVICEHQSVSLSSIAHDHERVGYMAAATLERLMSGGTASRALVRVKPRGVVTRASTDTFAVNDPALRPAVDFIEKNLGRPFGAAQIAEALGVPRIRLDRLFAAKLGHSAGAEIARRRIALAKRLLQTTDLGLSDIAGYCGYCHATFLIRTFKKAVGVTPVEWRRRNARG